MKSILCCLPIFLIIQSCGISDRDDIEIPENNMFAIVLGVTQDGGYPQAGCEKDCCRGKSEPINRVSSLAIVDPEAKVFYMLDAGPDFASQLKTASEISGYDLGGIFLTHAHIGHYIGLVHLGHEVMGAKDIPVYTLPRMADFLKNNGPWSQLVGFNNIKLETMTPDSTFILSTSFQIRPVQVPHRDEFSETAGFIVEGTNKSLLYLPDIDKWGKWEKDIIEVVKNVDYAFLDGSFFDDKELPGRNMDEIPHPFISESMELFKDLPKSERSKIYFIHLNHTNQALRKTKERDLVLKEGFNISSEGKILDL